MTGDERAWDECLTAQLIAANLREFHQRVGQALRLFLEGRLTAVDALGQIRRVHEVVTRYNNSLDLTRQLPPAETGG
jgi:hypothetical protein